MKNRPERFDIGPALASKRQDIPIDDTLMSTVETSSHSSTSVHTTTSESGVQAHQTGPHTSSRGHSSSFRNEDNVDNKTVFLIIGAVIGIFLLFIVGFALYNHFNPAPQTIDDLHALNYKGDLSEDQGYMYNGHSFVLSDGLWWSEVTRDGRTVKFPVHFGPREVESIPIVGGLSPQFENGTDVYITRDPTIKDGYYNLAISELSFNIAEGIALRPVGACTQQDPVCENRTIVTCDTAAGRPVVEFALSNITQVTLRDTCILIQGQGYDIVKAVDRLLFNWYNIIKRR